MRVLKIGGNELDNADFLAGFAAAVAAMDEPVVIVHGGGKAIGELHNKMGLPTVKVQGLRVTNADSLRIAEMVLSGLSNKILVRALLAAGVEALGISGVDGGLLTAEKKQLAHADLGYVGTIYATRCIVLHKLIAQGFTPVVSPISLGLDGSPYNVNADEAATGLAIGLQAEQLDFISNVPGVLHDGDVIASLNVEKTEALIAEDVIYGGMIPKVRSALAALEKGVTRTRIVNLAGFSGAGGTIFKNET